MSSEQDNNRRILIAVGVFGALGMLILAAIACALTAAVPPTATPEPTETFVEQIVVTPTPDPPTETPVVRTVVVTQSVVITQPVAVGAANPAPLNIVISPNCQVRTDWLAYTVQAGDTVGGLAIRTNTSLNDLVIGNCLTNPDVINVGETLYLPRQPTGVLPVPATAPPGRTAPEIGFVLVEPAIVDEAQYLVAPGSVIIRAIGVENATAVSFYMAPTNTSAAPTLLGTDETMGDGANLVWTAGAEPFVVNVWAVATGDAGLEAATNPILVVNNG